MASTRSSKGHVTKLRSACCKLLPMHTHTHMFKSPRNPPSSARACFQCGAAAATSAVAAAAFATTVLRPACGAVAGTSR